MMLFQLIMINSLRAGMESIFNYVESHFVQSEIITKQQEVGGGEAFRSDERCLNVNYTEIKFNINYDLLCINM